VPVVPPERTVIVAVPADLAVTTPVRSSTVATRGLLLDHSRDAGSAIGTVSAVRSSPVTLVPVAVSCSDEPTVRLALGAVTAIEASTGCAVAELAVGDRMRIIRRHMGDHEDHL
jgi:hypothetical protein